MKAPVLSIALCVLGVVALAGGAEEEQPVAKTVVFVCAHGNVKSLIAALWFERLAEERGLPIRAVSRGVAPETPVPPAVVAYLAADGLTVGAFEPRALAPEDVEAAERVVMIGVAPPSWVAGTARAVETWDGIPPTSEGYAESRDAMRKRIVALLESLAGPGPAR
jgi:arsenate reductase (thioredoxin)